ncbi:MAG: hypothetical protein QE271_14330 [Bacteriovoracaceae bacterium]|nr:hypothetical protein [Bacteriovoracaceae bacterium]
MILKTYYCQVGVTSMFNLSRNFLLFFVVLVFNFENTYSACKPLLIPHHYKLNFSITEQNFIDRYYTMIDFLLSRRTGDGEYTSKIDLFLPYKNSSKQITSVMVVDSKNKIMLSDGAPIVASWETSFFNYMGGNSYADMLLLHFFMDKITYLLAAMPENFAHYEQADQRARKLQLLLEHGSVFDDKFPEMQIPRPNQNQSPHVFEKEVVEFITTNQSSLLWMSNFYLRPNTQNNSSIPNVYWHKLPIILDVNSVWKVNEIPLNGPKRPISDINLAIALGFNSDAKVKVEEVRSSMAGLGNSRFVIQSGSEFSKWKYYSTEPFQVYDYMMAFYLNDFYSWSVSNWYHFLTQNNVLNTPEFSMDVARQNFKKFFMSSMLMNGKLKEIIDQNDSAAIVLQLNIYVADIILKLQKLISQNQNVKRDLGNVNFLDKLLGTNVYLSDYVSPDDEK